MSQAKVDKHKKEKKNRAKEIRKQKLKTALWVVVLSVGLGALVGIPLGRGIYKYQKRKAEQNKTVSSLQYNTWFDNMWAEEYSDLYAGMDFVEADDASATDADGSTTDAAE